jgi:succinate-semialdehyde dehydrogenase/glutarate-semialdehyde dehydrogenase
MSNLRSINPFTLEELSVTPELEDHGIAERIDRSNQAFLSFRKTSIGFRRELMFRAARLLRERKEEYGRMASLEMGKRIGEAVAEVEKCAWVCEHYAQQARRILTGREIKTDASLSRIVYQPLGPLLAVMPWNFPYWQVFRFAAPALMAGNTVLLKHASNVQGCAGYIERVFADAGFHDGVFQNLAIGSGKVAKVIASPGVKAVTLTGSEEAGKAVAAKAGKHLKKCVLELGGNNACVVLNDADLSLAVDTALTARLQNSGQSCIAAKRFILETRIHDRFIEMLLSRLEDLQTGDPLEPGTDIAPLFSVRQADEVDQQVKKSVKVGARLVAGGEKKGAFYTPVVLTGVTPGMPVFEEETFGPVFAITRADDLARALELSNLSRFGLGVQVFTGSSLAADLFEKQAEEGAVFVNGMVKSDPRLPFGGIKSSGYGRELSDEGMLEFVNVKTIWEK